MARQPVIEMERRLKGGREYLTALKKLGFIPDALLWAGVGDQAADGAMELLIVTSWVDEIGPKAIYDLLFEAYDASATPKDIDPFIVTLFSPETQIAIDLKNAIYTLRSDARAKPSKEVRPVLFLGMMDYYTIPSWIIFSRPSKSDHFDILRRFHAFQNNVAKLAA